MAPTEETAPEMTGAMAGGVDLRANKVGLDTGGGAAKNGGFKDHVVKCARLERLFVRT